MHTQKERIDEFLQYHIDSSREMDIDCQVESIMRIAGNSDLDRLIWMAFLYATTYCMATTYYIWKTIPDPLSHTMGSLEKWWKENKDGLIFTSDKHWIKAGDFFVGVIMSYNDFVRRMGSGSAGKAVRNAIEGKTQNERCESLFRNAGFYNFGRFSEFLFSEILYYAGFDVVPNLDLAMARIARNGVVFAMGLEEYSYTRRHGRSATKEELEILNAGLDRIVAEVQKMDIYERHKSIWSIETTLCAYKKFKLGKRWVGYYADRNIREIKRMMERHPSFDWTALVDFTKEQYPERWRNVNA